VKRLLLIATLLGSLLVVSLPGPASAAGVPCREKISQDWLVDGKIASTYPLSCYRDALKHMNADASIYSSLGDDIRAAMRAATRRTQGLSSPAQVGKGFKPLSNVKASIVVNPTAPHDPTSSNAVATPAAAGTGSGGAPLPLLVLGGVALALVAAGAIGAGVRHARGPRD
jgi:hypothetical protein